MCAREGWYANMNELIVCVFTYEMVFAFLFYIRDHMLYNIIYICIIT